MHAGWTLEIMQLHVCVNVQEMILVIKIFSECIHAKMIQYTAHGTCRKTLRGRVREVNWFIRCLRNVIHVYDVHNYICTCTCTRKYFTIRVENITLTIHVMQHLYCRKCTASCFQSDMLPVNGKWTQNHWNKYACMAKLSASVNIMHV